MKRWIQKIIVFAAMLAPGAAWADIAYDPTIDILNGIAEGLENGVWLFLSRGFPLFLVLSLLLAICLAIRWRILRPKRTLPVAVEYIMLAVFIVVIVVCEIIGIRRCL